MNQPKKSKRLMAQVEFTEAGQQRLELIQKFYRDKYDKEITVEQLIRDGLKLLEYFATASNIGYTVIADENGISLLSRESVLDDSP